MKDRQDRKEYYDRNARDLRPLTQQESVLVQNPQTELWEKAAVEARCPEPRSYIVKTENGSTVRRNRRHIREKKNPPSNTTECQTKSHGEERPESNNGDITDNIQDSGRPRREIKKTYKTNRRSITFKRC